MTLSRCGVVAKKSTKKVSKNKPWLLQAWPGGPQEVAGHLPGLPGAQRDPRQRRRPHRRGTRRRRQRRRHGELCKEDGANRQ